MGLQIRHHRAAVHPHRAARPVPGHPGGDAPVLPVARRLHARLLHPRAPPLSRPRRGGRGRGGLPEVAGVRPQRSGRLRRVRPRARDRLLPPPQGLGGGLPRGRPRPGRQGALLLPTAGVPLDRHARTVAAHGPRRRGLGRAHPGVSPLPGGLHPPELHAEPHRLPPPVRHAGAARARPEDPRPSPPVVGAGPVSAEPHRPRRLRGASGARAAGRPPRRTPARDPAGREAEMGASPDPGRPHAGRRRGVVHQPGPRPGRPVRPTSWPPQAVHGRRDPGTPSGAGPGPPPDGECDPRRLRHGDARHAGLPHRRRLRGAPPARRDGRGRSVDRPELRLRRRSLPCAGAAVAARRR